MTLTELQHIKELLNMLRIKCKTDALYLGVIKGIEIIDREIEEKNVTEQK